MGWPAPTQDSDPWFDRFKSLVFAVDSSFFASREDHELIVTGCAEFTFDATTDSLSWAGIQNFVSPFSGFGNALSAGSATMREGEVLFVNLSRAPTATAPTAAATLAIVPNTDDAFALCIRCQNEVYFRTGAKLSDGETINILAPVEPELTTLNIANRQTYSDVTPLVAGAIAFDPTDHTKDGMDMEVTFRAVVASGNEGIEGHVRLVNRTDSETVVTLDITTSTETALEQQLVLGSGTGQIDSAEHIYEAQIFLDGAPSAGDSIELYSASIYIENFPPSCS